MKIPLIIHISLLLHFHKYLERLNVLQIHVCYFYFFLRDGPQWAGASSFMGFLDHTQRRTTVCRTPLDERSARRRDLYVTHNTQNRQTPIPQMGFEPTISAGKRPQIDDLESTTIGTSFTSS